LADLNIYRLTPALSVAAACRAGRLANPGAGLACAVRVGPKGVALAEPMTRSPTC